MDKYIVKARVVFDVLEVIKQDGYEDDYYCVETFNEGDDDKNMKWATEYAKQLNIGEAALNG